MAKKCIVDLDKAENAERVALTRLESLSYEAVRLVLKKRSQTLASWRHVKVTDQRTK